MRSSRRVLNDAVDAARKPAGPPAGYYIKLGRAAMACHFEVFLRPEDRLHIPRVVEALDEVDALEQQMSVYREDSELTLLNRTAALRPVEVETRLYGLLCLARDIGVQTGGAYDITTGALIRCWGFMHRQGRVPYPDELASARACSGWQHVEFDDAARTVFFRREGVELNLGSIGKGYALDRLAESLTRAGVRDFMAHSGYSSIVARGDASSGRGWEIRLRGGGESEAPGVRLINEAMSTSGTGVQYFESDGRRYGHILDPRSGWPAADESSCSVVASRAAVAEALSTAACAMSVEEMRTRYRRNGDVCIILTGSNENGLSAPVVLGKPARWAEEARP